SGFAVMGRLIGLVKPLARYMVLAIAMGLMGHLCAAFITIFGGFAALNVLGLETPLIPGILVLQYILEQYQVSQLTVSRYGAREGYLRRVVQPQLTAE
ncbi:MAG: hypothetical protein PUC06_09085, partial [Oscillospiraceae bacterium]|nr:hypothetical protein [Oscillospiraceae bacterium]